MKRKLLIVFFIFSSLWLSAQEDLLKLKIKNYHKIHFNHFQYNELELSFSDTLHTSLKPLHFFEINNQIILEKYKQLKLGKKKWLGRKFFDEHFVAIIGNDYWITIDPVINLSFGKDNLRTDTYTFQNTRGILVEGTLGKQFSFSSYIAENYARIPVFLDRYIWGTWPRVVPGYEINISEDRNYVDYPHARGYIAYKPSKFFFFELGHGNHFISDGYRSLFLSDKAGVYPYFKAEATFWKVKYSTIWSAYQDIRPEATVNGVYRKKYAATHYIDWNVTSDLNLGFFETVIWHDENDRGFDINFLNPVIFFKFSEVHTGSQASNSLIGLSARYKLPYGLKVYGQFILDEMTMQKFFNVKGYWANKFGYQIGLKYNNAFQIPHLFLRAEYNSVRPYTYGHKVYTTNYTNNYLPLAHPWGANFEEKIFEIQYSYKRWYISSLISTGKKGFDYPDDDYGYGGNINNYIIPENYSDNVYTLQGNLGEIFFNQTEGGYLLNPATRLKLFGGIIFRKTNVEVETSTVKNETTKYLYLGIKTQLWNDHFDIF